MKPKAFGWATKKRWRDKLGKVLDASLAKRIGIFPSEVSSTRKALGIEPVRNHSGDPERDRRLLERFDDGDPPKVLSLRFGITRERVRQILFHHGRDSAANRPIGKTKAIPRHLLGTATDGEIGRRFGVSTTQVCQFRLSLGIAAFRKVPKPDIPKLIRMRAKLERGMSYADIGRAEGCKTLNPSQNARDYLLKWKDLDLTTNKRTGT